ncbi:TIGR02569 family protein [Kytococcus sedentarius]|uniref:TIGR02569 family protein n=1 Tax=Kytococcus sedentarius TaxID=1276 RepID=UPI0035BBE989
MSTKPPPTHVLEAFGGRGRPQLLSGGQGTTWLCGDLVLKPGVGDVETWLVEVIEGMEQTGFRCADPVRTRGGEVACDGWMAQRRLAGRDADLSDRTTWLPVLEGGRAFHRAVAKVPRPSFLDSRHDWWARADRLAWAEERPAVTGVLAPVARRLATMQAPLGESQLVHADLTGNVMLAAGQPPAIIDISPYWRPPSYAEGVVVADLLMWWGADRHFLEDTAVPVPAVARALLFRLLTTQAMVEAGVAGLDLHDEAARHERATRILGV